MSITNIIAATTVATIANTNMRLTTETLARRTSKQKGGATAIVLTVLALVGVLIAGAIWVAISTANYGNRTEASIKGIWENNQNILGQYTLKVQEAAAVPGMYKDDLKEVMTSVMSARQGPDGSRAMFQFFKEHAIAIDPAMYVKIQQIVEAGRNEFQTAQQRLIDSKITYRTELGQIPRGWILGAVGYPKIQIGYPNIDVDDYKPVVAGDTREVFKSGVQAPVKMR